MKPIDLHSPRWVCFGDPERTILFAFAGGYWLRAGVGSRFVHAPIAGVIGAWMLGAQGFVASRLGLVYRWDQRAAGEGRWTVIEAPFLEGQSRATVWSVGERLFVDDGTRTCERVGDGWVPRPFLLPHVRFATRDATGLILASDTTVHRVNLDTGEEEVLLAASDRPGEGRALLDVCVGSVGGLHVIDDAGTLVHVTGAGRLQIRHLGGYSRSLRHQYLDPEPDAVVDIDSYATLLPSGRALSIRRGGCRLYDGGELRHVAAMDRFRPLVRGLGEAPSVAIEGFDGGELLLRTGDGLDAARLALYPSALRRARSTLDVRGEVFGLEGDGVNVVTPSETLRLPLGTTPRWLLEDWDEDRAPMVVDVEGGLHRFDGVRYERIVSARAPEPLLHACGVGTKLFLAGKTSLWGHPIPDALDAQPTPLDEPELLQALLAPGPRDLLVRRLAIGQGEISQQLSLLRQVGRTAAGIHLRALMGDGQDQAMLAAQVMAGLGPQTQFRLFELEGRLEGWIAAEAETCLVVVDDRSWQGLLAAGDTAR